MNDMNLYLQKNWKQIRNKVRKVTKNHQNTDDLINDLVVTLLDKPYEVLMVLSCFYPEMEFVEFVEKVNEFSIFKYDNYYLFLQKTDGFKGIKLYYYYQRRIKSKSRLNQIASKSGGSIFSENEASYNIDRNARRFIEKYMDKIY